MEPILLELIEGALESARREVELQIARTARSTAVREQGDHRAGIFDASGRSVTSLSVAPTPTPVIEKFAGSIRPGDVFIFNDCYKSHGGITHLGDICITVPVFFDGTIVAYVQDFGHVKDIGGTTPGSAPIDATSIFQEGLMIPPVRLYDAGVRNAALYDTILNNSRFPGEVRGDIDAFVSACSLAVERVIDLCERHGREVVETVFEFLLERCARDLRDTVLPQIPDGTYEFEDFVEFEGVVAHEPRKFIRLRVALIKRPGEVVFDFTGTDAQVAGPLNYPGSESYYAKFLGALFKIYAPDIVINDGVNRVIGCVVPRGTVVSPEFPAPCAWRTWPMLRMLDVGMGALAKATGGRVPGSSETITSYGLFGRNEGEQLFLLREITGGGSGARAGADGVDTVSLVPGQKNMPAEFAETFYPIVVERKGLRIDSGGIGEYRGGLGYWMDVRMLTQGTLLLHNDRVRLHPWGVAGGGAGAPSIRILNPGTESERLLPAKDDTVPFRQGDVLRILTPGGGGWGDPLERAPEAVRLDVLRGFVSAGSARGDFGVVLDAAGLVDAAATVASRERGRAERAPLWLTDRGAGFREALASGDLTMTTDDPLLRDAVRQ